MLIPVQEPVAVGPHGQGNVARRIQRPSSGFTVGQVRRIGVPLEVSDVPRGPATPPKQPPPLNTVRS